MTDRLAELTEGTGILVDGDDELDEIDIEDSDEENDGLDSQERQAIKKFETEADALSKAIDKIQENVEIIESQYQVSLGANMKPSDKTEASNNISRIIAQTERTSEAIRKRLKRIAGENQQYSQDNPGSTGQLRVRVNAHQGLTKRFMETMQGFEETQEKHRDNVRGALERQLRLMNPDAEEHEIQEALRMGATDTVIENSPVLTQLPPEEQARLRNGLADLKSRNNDIKKLEESIIQLHQLFTDMQLLVQSQGQLLNDIEHNIDDTKGKTKEGLEELVRARAHQKSATKKKICVCVLIIAVLLAILIPILIKFIPIWFPSTQEAVDLITGNNTSIGLIYINDSSRVYRQQRFAVNGAITALDILFKEESWG